MNIQYIRLANLTCQRETHIVRIGPVYRLDRHIFRVGLVGICIVPVFVLETHLVDRLGKAIQLQAWTDP